MSLVIGLFEQGSWGARLLGRSRDPELVELVQERLAVSARAELRDIESQAPPRIVPLRQPEDEA